MEYHPKYVEAVTLIYLGTKADPGFLDTREGMQHALTMIRYSPPDSQLRAKIINAKGPLPQPHGYTDDGKPLYLPEQIDAWAGATAGYTKNRMDGFLSEHEEDYYHRGAVNLRH